MSHYLKPRNVVPEMAMARDILFVKSIKDESSEFEIKEFL